MCLAVPGKVLEVNRDLAVVEFQGNRMEVSTVLTPEARAGDWVLIHAGFAITRIDEQTARETWAYLDEMHGDSSANNTSMDGFSNG